MAKNYFKGSWKDNFEDMRVQSEKIRKATGLDGVVIHEEEDEEDLPTYVVTPEGYKEAMYAAMLRARSEREQQNNSPRLKSSSKVKQLNFTAKNNPNSTTSRIQTILKEFGEGLHITRIIEELTKRNQLPKSVYHCYSHISHLLNNNYLLFEKIGPATFKSREVQIWDPPVIKGKGKTFKQVESPSIKDLILWAAKKYAKKLGNSPRNITDALALAGIDVAYDTVKKVLLENREQE